MVEAGDRLGIYQALSTGDYPERYVSIGRHYLGAFEVSSCGVTIVGDGKIPLYMFPDEVRKVGTVLIKRKNGENEKKGT